MTEIQRFEEAAWNDVGLTEWHVTPEQASQLVEECIAKPDFRAVFEETGVKAVGPGGATAVGVFVTHLVHPFTNSTVRVVVDA